MKKSILVSMIMFLACACEPRNHHKQPEKQTGHYAYDDPTSLDPVILEAADVTVAQATFIPVVATPVAAAQKVCIPSYTLTVETRMHSISLNPFKHIRNRMNGNVYTIPVDEFTYNNAYVGSVLDKSFDSMGLVMKGSWQSVKTTVIAKQKTCY